VPVVASSVNAPLLARVEQMVGEVLDQNVLLVGRDVPLSMKLAVENPETLGSDRVLSAQAAYAVVGNAVVVASFGTATTIDLVNEHGIFLGGAILPGLATAAASLHEHTAALPEAPLQVPEGDYGTSTIGAIQHGIYYGAIGALREIVERYATQLGRWPQLVVTGGFGRLIAQHCDFLDSLVPDLCLNGLFLAYRHHREAMESQIQQMLGETGVDPTAAETEAEEP
jgi:type III pantothenate kinase